MQDNRKSQQGLNTLIAIKSVEQLANCWEEKTWTKIVFRENKMKILVLTIFSLAKFCNSSPIVDPEAKKKSTSDGNVPKPPEGICHLPEELGHSGNSEMYTVT